MNISRQNIIGICNLKCNLAFNYPKSNCSATNYGNSIKLSYDNGSSPPVKYNNEDYNVQDINIVSPSRHLFNGSQVPGEIFINHISTSGAPALVICIPIISGGMSLQLLEDIIQQVSTGAANSGESTIVKTDYELNNVVPLRPFFNYTSENKEWVVYGVVDAVNLTDNTINTLKTLITPMPPIIEGAKLYVNTRGPNREKNDGQIYIDCKPTGQSQETTEIEREKEIPDVSFNSSEILKSPIFIFMMGGLIFFVIIFGLNALLSYMTGTKIPALSELQDKFSSKNKPN